MLKGAVRLDVDQYINMLQTIYKDDFGYIQLKSQLFTQLLQVWNWNYSPKYATKNEGTD